MIFRIFFLIFIFCISLSVSAGRGFIVESIGTEKTIAPRKNMIEKVLSADALQFGYSALSIILDTAQIEPRGKMKGKQITLSSSVQKDSEFIQLFIHEIAHYVDMYTFIKTSRRTDASDIFYAISWQNKNTKKPNEILDNFISGYAASNQYEDFAESFTFFMFHNSDFAYRAMKNESLRQKYLFFTEYVFPDGNFSGTDFRIGNIPGYFWDTTKIPISVKKYLYSLQ